MSEVTKPIALDESFNTTGQTPKNIADVIKNGLQEVAQAIDSHQGGGGHVILDQNGNALDQEPNMQFVDAHTSDDSVNTKTIIENIKSVTEAQFESATEDGLYDVDVEGAEIGEISEEYVEVTADGVKTRAQLLTDLNALVDWSKVNENSYIVFGNDIYRVNVPNVKIFMTSAISGGHLYNTMFDLNNHISQQFDTTTSTTTLTDNSSNKPTRGRKITLYYGTDKAVVDLQTTANRCLMADGVTSVEEAIAELIVKDKFYYTLGALSSGNMGYFEKSVAKSEYTPILATCSIGKTAVVNGKIMLNGSLSGNSFYGTYRAFDTISASDSDVAIEVIYKKA